MVVVAAVAGVPTAARRMIVTTPAAAAPGRDRTILWGALGIIVGLLCCGILGVIFGALSLRDAGRYRNTRVIGVIAIVVSILSMIGSGALFATGNYPGLA
jgi:hypothetical protein